MNARIQKLAKQADDGYTGDNRDDMGHALVGEDAIEKFAELIIQECMDIALAEKKWVQDQSVFDPRDQAWNKARIHQSQHIVDKIKQHFGVEE